MKRVLGLLAISALCIVATVYASDVGILDVTLSFNADSTTALGRTLNADTGSAVYVGDYPQMTMRWEINLDNDSAFTNDSLWIKGQYAQHQGGTWIDIPGFVDTIAIGANDTVSYKRDITVPRDSFGVWARAIVTHGFTSTGSDTADLAGNGYTWRVIPYFDKVLK